MSFSLPIERLYRTLRLAGRIYLSGTAYYFRGSSKITQKLAEIAPILPYANLPI